MEIFENGSMERILVTVGHHVCCKATKAYLLKDASFGSVSGKKGFVFVFRRWIYFCR